MTGTSDNSSVISLCSFAFLADSASDANRAISAKRAAAAATAIAGSAFTVREKVALAVPVAFVAVIVYVTAAASAVGVPEIAPVEVLKLRPFEIAGEME